MSPILPDLRYAARTLAQRPGFSLVIVLTLALGIGANTAIFSFIEGVLLRPLPYPQADRLVRVCETNPERPADWCGASPANWLDWTQHVHSIESLGLVRDWPFEVKVGDTSRGVNGGIATPGLFQSLGVVPVMGRVFSPQDIESGREHVAILSHAFWQSRMAAAADALSKTILIDGEAYAVIGVLPAGFEVPDEEGVEVWIPLWPERLKMRDWRGFATIGRLRAGASLIEARAELDTIHAQLARAYPEANRAWGLVVDSLHERAVRSVRPALLLFLGAVTFVLLIVCANVANLLLARATSREKEFAVRLALGAGRTRLVRQLLTESVLYSLSGGILGALFALWAVDLFRVLAPRNFPRLELVGINPMVLLFVILLSLLTSIVFGLAPALNAGRSNLVESLKEGQGSGMQRRTHRLRDTLVVVEIAFACVLLVGSGLLIRSFVNLLQWKPGFDRTNLVMVQLFCSPGTYPKIETVAELFHRATQEVGALPGVVSAGAGSAVPLLGGDGEDEFYVEGRPIPPPGQRPAAAWYDVDPAYFQTLRVPLVKGRQITLEDDRSRPSVAVINETFARRIWPNENPIGQRVHLMENKLTLEIVGVVGDIHPFRPDEKPRPEIFWPFRQQPRWAIQIVARASSSPAAIVPAIRSALEKLDPNMSIGRMITMDERVDRQLITPRFNMSLLGIFAGLSLAIAMIGVYSVMSFSVAQRTREIGVRMALGAHPEGILRLVLGKAAALSAAGLLLGLCGALALTRLLQTLLVEVAPTDPLTFAIVGMAMLGIALVASLIPARRASRVNPVVALRYE